MTGRPLNILLVEDHPFQALMLKAQLADYPECSFKVTWVEQFHAIAPELEKQRFDAVLLDLSLPDSEGIETISMLKAMAPALPIIVVTGSQEEEIAVRAVQEGAQDYLVKDGLTGAGIARTIRYAIDRKHSEQRYWLLAETTGRLLEADDPQAVVEDLCRSVMEFLDCQLFMNYLIVPGGGRMGLNACAGVPPEARPLMERVVFGVGICGHVARSGQRFVAEHVSHASDARSAQIRAWGVEAFCCHPLRAQGELIGTLAFGTCTRPAFSADELELMKHVADHVAIAMQRKQAERQLVALNHELEQRIRERTAALEETEAKFRSLVENSFDILCQIDGAGLVSYVGPQSRRYGVASADLEGRHFIELVYPEDQERLIRNFKQTLSKRTPNPTQFRMVVPSIGVCWFEERSTIQYDASGSVAGLTIVLRDITENKRSEVERDRLNRQRQLALDAARLGWWSYDPVRKVSIIDQRYAEIFGISGGERMRDEILQLVHPEDVDRLRKRFETVMNPADPKPYANEYQILRSDGEIRWIEAHGLAVFEGDGEARRAIEVVGTVADITEWKNNDRILRESEERYRVLFDSESDAILVIDGETRRFIDLNPVAEKMYGYTREEFLSLTHEQITAESEPTEDLIEKILAGFRPSMILTHHRQKDGTVFPVEISASSLVLHGRRVVSAVIRDITKRMAQEQELHRNRGELRHLASELSLSNQRERQRIAGELHDGLCQLLSSAYLRLDALKMAPMPEKTAGTIEKVCEILQQAISQTRSLTFDLSCPMLDELGLAAALEDLCSSMSHEYAIQFKFQGDARDFPLHSDVEMIIYRAARELLINVMKHSGAHTAWVQLARLENGVRLTVTDDGKGFDSSTAGRGISPEGGFGLFNIGEYVQHAGGDLSVKSAPGGGTQVILRIPLREG